MSWDSYTAEERKAAFRSGHFAVDRDSAQAQGLVGWWPLGWGPTEKDFSVFNRHGTRVATPSVSVTNHPKWGAIKQLDFNGSSQYVSVPAPNSYTAWTICCTAESDVNSGAGSGGGWTLVSNDQSGWNDDVLFGLTPEGTTRSTDGRWAVVHQDADQQVRTIAQDTIQISTGQPYSVAARSDGSNLALFRDGVERGSSAKSGTALIFNGATINIGRNPQNIRYYNGRIGDVRFYGIAAADSLLEQIHEEPWRLVAPIGVRTISFAAAAGGGGAVPFFRPLRVWTRSRT